jgi:hypothetical protein
MELGKYKHYKGGKYQVIDTCTHSESLEKLVLYKSLKDNSLWVRPYEMFNETIELEGKTIKRFEYLGE